MVKSKVWRGIYRSGGHGQCPRAWQVVAAECALATDSGKSDGKQLSCTSGHVRILALENSPECRFPHSVFMGRADDLWPDQAVAIPGLSTVIGWSVRRFLGDATKVRRVSACPSSSDYRGDRDTNAQTVGAAIPCPSLPYDTNDGAARSG